MPTASVTLSLDSVTTTVVAQGSTPLPFTGATPQLPIAFGLRLTGEIVVLV